MSTTMHARAPGTNPTFDTIDNLPRRVRDIATLRGLGYSFREIARELEVSPQAISLTISRHRRLLKSLRGAAELHGLSSRAINALSRFGIRTRAEAANRDALTLLRGERNCGAKTLREIGRWIVTGEPAAPATEQHPGEV